MPIRATTNAAPPRNRADARGSRPTSTSPRPRRDRVDVFAGSATAAAATTTTTAHANPGADRSGAAHVRFERGVLKLDGRNAIERAKMSRAGALALLAAAPEIGAGTARLGASSRAAIAQALLPLLRTRTAGRPAQQDVANRAAAFVILSALAGARGATAASTRAWRAELARAHEVEPFAPLADFMGDFARDGADRGGGGVVDVFRLPEAPSVKSVLAQMKSAPDLASAVAVVARDVPYSDVADAVLRAYGKSYAKAPLSWALVERALTKDGGVDTDRLARGMREAFLEVNPKRTAPAFRKYIGAALELLRKSNAGVAKAAVDAIESGRVRIDTLDDLTRADYLRVRRDYLKDGTALPERFDPDDHKSRAWRAVTQDLNGYMWDDRIYVTAGQSPQQLAATLVHEVNHVLNESEEHYRGEKQILLEEYRAFYAEALFRHDGKKPSAAECKRIKDGVIRDYGLHDVTAADVADVPPGIFEG